MTTNSPRIYVYKITFEEVPYYYYGVHKEKKFNEDYWGSPVTNKWCWDRYTPKKQILEIFDYSDEGWIEAQKVESRIIKQFFNTNKWCLNESCGGINSLKIRRKNGEKIKEFRLGVFARTPEEMSEHGKAGAKKAKELGLGIHAFTHEQRSENGKKTKELGLGIFSRTPEQMTEHGKIGGRIGGKIGGKIVGVLAYELGIGIFALTPEEKLENSIKGGKRAKELGLGIHAFTPEQRIENARAAGKIGGKKTKELGVGVHSRTPEQMSEHGKIGGKRAKELGVGVCALTKEQRAENAKITNSQKWQCTITGHISTPGPLSMYQKARGIDPTNRIRIQ